MTTTIDPSEPRVLRSAPGARVVAGREQWLVEGTLAAGAPRYEDAPVSAQDVAMTIQKTTLLQGDACEMLRTLPDRSVQCIVSSPPYFGLRKYTDDAREIGHEPTPAAFVAALVAVFHEARRVLRDDGTLWVVIGDSYANDSKWGGRTGGKHAKALHGETGIGREKRTTGLPDGTLIGTPWRLAFALQDDGWILRQEIIWSKPNGMPDPTTTRCTRTHETVFMLSKCKSYYYDAAAIAEKAVAKKAAHLVAGKGEYGDGFAERWQPKETRNARSVWSIATTGLAEDHYAPMPEELARRCILAGSAAGDTVLDPFMGSGTVGRVAEKLQRYAIGIDLGYQELQQKRTDKIQVEMFV